MIRLKRGSIQNKNSYNPSRRIVTPFVLRLFPQRKQRERAAHHRSRRELKTPRIATGIHVVKVCKGTPSGRLVDPSGNLGDEHLLRVGLGYSGCEQLPIHLGPDVARVENNAILLLRL